ncbi:ABC-2 type transporter family protein [Mycobacterium kansasii 662]|uniref:ABC-2 type transporter family protein n=1 Tax=Mycobacterium kansasii 662 TaxID=1299326 RepID=X7XYK2_MYCKA|nr:ABC transporter permease [Mycobacterium kansasii]ETZ99224.1 ABC-2 type transporter family protein [Mycobacterium kansasii 662]
MCRRYLAVIAADRQYSVFLLALPLLLSLFAHAVPGNAGLSLAKAIEERSTQPSQLLVLLIIGGALMGCAASIREIVKEQAIYRREHGIGLSASAYLASKLVVLTALTTIQGLILGFLGTLFLPPPDSSVLLPQHADETQQIWWRASEVAVAVVAVTVVSMIIGLLISAADRQRRSGHAAAGTGGFMAQTVLCGRNVRGERPPPLSARPAAASRTYAMAAHIPWG